MTRTAGMIFVAFLLGAWVSLFVTTLCLFAGFKVAATWASVSAIVFVWAAGVVYFKEIYGGKK